MRECLSNSTKVRRLLSGERNQHTTPPNRHRPRIPTLPPTCAPKVLGGMTVHVTEFPKSVNVPPPAEMKAIVQAAGGTWAAKLPSNPAANLLVISCKEAVEKDKGLGTKVRKLIAGGVSGGFISTTTCLFDAVMRKELRFDGEGHVVPDASLGAPPAPGGSTSATSSGSRSRKRGR
mmetsp:Transcript_102588/g.293837  ORF Transcript_102588/g.293837 Transcript_102588/m.293837 type:complete len:176 (-) Transcript_102588:311-838(-)